MASHSAGDAACGRSLAADRPCCTISRAHARIAHKSPRELELEPMPAIPLYIYIYSARTRLRVFVL
jgi:hypothetical protein